MGNETSGFAVLNLSGYTLHMGLSMAATHYYENNVEHGEIFYRWPGAVHYTVYAQTAPELSDGTCAKEITKSSVLGVTSAVVGAISGICLTGVAALSGLASGSIVAGKYAVIATATAAAGAGAAVNYAVVNEIMDVLASVPAADRYAEMKGCYGGGSGSWLVLRGGLHRDHGYVEHEKLRLEVATPAYVMSNGRFTSYSREKYYTTDAARRHTDTVHDCTRTDCKLL